MEMTTTKKKIMLAAILTSGLTLAISQAAFSQPEQAAQASTPGKPGTPPCAYQMSPEIQQARNTFLNETVAIRKELAEKNAAMRALMHAGTPDTTKASQLAGELFELREKLRLKAQETGRPLPVLMLGQGHGNGMFRHGMHGKHRLML